MTRRQLLRSVSFLTGGSVLAPAALSTLLQGCAQEDRRTWQPAYFTNEEADFVTAYVDTLLPRTDTPGGLDVGVDVFIDKVMALTSVGPQTDSPLRTGIRDFDDAAREGHGAAFAKLDLQRRGELFAAAEERSPRYNPRVWGTVVGEEPPIDFYRSLKSMTLWGYLTSETIGTEILNYDPVPGGYDGDIPLESVGGRAWSP